MGMVTTVKFEMRPLKHHLCSMEAHLPVVVKSVKHHKRESCAFSQPQPQPQPQPGQVFPSTTTTGLKRSSRFRGVSRHRWTGRFEAHLWDKGSWNATQRKKGKQGAYNVEETAARGYDLAAIKYWGPTTFTNIPASDYETEMEIMQNVTKVEYLASLRRRSSGFSRVNTKIAFLDDCRHHHNGRWEARIGRVFGNKYLYLGTYSTQEEAAHAYEIATIEYRGINAMPVSPCNKSSTSPTALGLLFRSSMFREMVEKNSSVTDYDTDKNEKK
ncbi:hypothetical protein ACSBR2_029118 [Camellia fascicularis]